MIISSHCASFVRLNFALQQSFRVCDCLFQHSFNSVTFIPLNLEQKIISVYICVYTNLCVPVGISNCYV